MMKQDEYDMREKNNKINTTYCKNKNKQGEYNLHTTTT